VRIERRECKTNKRTARRIVEREGAEGTAGIRGVTEVGYEAVAGLYVRTRLNLYSVDQV
jgi:hypothetical protein